MTDPYEAFERDIPEHLQEDALMAMAEATGGYGVPKNVHILDRDQLDAINYRAHGIIEIEGEEYTFQFEDGNWNGSVLLSWNEDKPFEHHAPLRYALQPLRHIIYRHVAAGKGPFLLTKWDAMLADSHYLNGSHTKLSEIPGKYAYDKFFQPGGKVESYWRDKAAERGFDIVLEEMATETRTLLERSTEPWQ